MDRVGVWCRSVDAISCPDGRRDFCFGGESSSFGSVCRTRCIRMLAPRFIKPIAALFGVGGRTGHVAEGWFDAG